MYVTVCDAMDRFINISIQIRHHISSFNLFRGVCAQYIRTLFPKVVRITSFY